TFVLQPCVSSPIIHGPMGDGKRQWLRRIRHQIDSRNLQELVNSEALDCATYAGSSTKPIRRLCRHARQYALHAVGHARPSASATRTYYRPGSGNATHLAG